MFLLKYSEIFQMDLYTEIILDHYKNPRNYGLITDFSGKAEEHNVMCGDKLTFYLKTDHNQRVCEVKFEGVGCAISQAGRLDAPT